MPCLSPNRVADLILVQRGIAIRKSAGLYLNRGLEGDGKLMVSFLQMAK